MIDVLVHEHLFHATPYWNFDPILRRGIDPAYSRGQLPVSWYVEAACVMWAIEHVAVRYRCNEQEVIVFEVTEQLKAKFFIAPQVGVYRTSCLMRPSAIYPSYNWFPKEDKNERESDS